MQRGIRNLGLAAGLLALLVLVLWVARSPARPGPRANLEERARTPSAAASSLVAADLAEGDTEGEQGAGTRASATVPGNPIADVDELGSTAEEPRLIVVGRAIDLDGRSVQGAELFVSDETGPAGRLIARSDESGRFRGELPRSLGARGFLLLAEHHRAAEIEVFDLGKVELQLGTVTLEPGSEIAGQVLDEAGRAIPGARVTWLPVSAFPEDPATARSKGFGVGRADYAELASGELGALRELGYGGEDGDAFAPDTLSGADGRFRLRGLPLGACFVAAWKKGRSYGWSPVFELRAAAASELEIVLLPSFTAALQVAGIVRNPAGAPAAGMLVRAKCGRAHTAMHTDADGTFLLDEGWTEPVELEARDEEQRWAPAVLAGVAPGTRGVELVLTEPVWLTVALRDAEEHPIPWGLVRLGVTRKDTGRDGSVRIQKPAEAFKLEVFAPGFRTQTFGPFDPAELGDELALHLVPGQAVRGRVVSGGRPVVGARLDLAFTLAPGVTHESWNAAPLEHPFQLTGRVELDGNDGSSDASGRFLLTVHSDGWHSLRVEAEGFPTSVFGPFLLAREATSDELELELERGGTLAGRVRFAPGAAGRERVVGVCNGWSFVRTAAIEGDGSYSIRDLAPGPYQVRVCAPPISALQQLFGSHESSEPVTWDCRVTPGTTTRHDLDLSQEGTVVLAGQFVLVGAAQAEWEAGLLSVPTDRTLSGALRAMAVLDPAGRFELVLSRPGAYRLCLTSGNLSVEQTVVLAAGRNEWKHHSETGRVRVRVFRSSAQDRPVRLRFRAEDAAGARLSAEHLAYRRNDDADVWLIEAPPARGVLEATDEPWARDARWTLVRELEVASGEELAVYYP